MLKKKSINTDLTTCILFAFFHFQVLGSCSQAQHIPLTAAQRTLSLLTQTERSAPGWEVHTCTSKTAHQHILQQRLHKNTHAAQARLQRGETSVESRRTLTRSDKCDKNKASGGAARHVNVVWILPFRRLQSSPFTFRAIFDDVESFFSSPGVTFTQNVTLHQ